MRTTGHSSQASPSGSVPGPRGALPAEPVEIVIADDQAEVRSALRLLLEEEGDLGVAGEAADAVGLLRLLGEGCGEILLLDWELGGVRGVDVMDELRNVRPELRIVALSGRPEARESAIRAGADAFVSKGEPPEKLLSVIRTLAAAGDSGAR
ncbi:MAG: hypothetical protein Kow00129_15780 [Thermoleophilia bacterium]